MPTINKTTPVRPWVPKAKPFTMKVNNQQFYNSAAWRKIAKSHKTQNPLCVNFETCGGVAEITDHIQPITEGGAKFDWGNLQSFCKSCNAAKTAKQGKK